MAHEKDEDLSALIDGELSAQEAERARTHAASCPDCGARLAKLQNASAAFKRSGEAAVPPEILTHPEQQIPADKENRAFRLLYALAVAIFLALASGLAMIRLLPGMFSQVQGMISGAAGQMGSGGK